MSRRSGQLNEGGLVAPGFVLLGLLIAWEAAVRVFSVRTYILPPPSGIIERLIADWPLLASNLHATLVVIGLGFLLAILISLILGILIAHSNTFRRGVYPLVIASQTIPVIAVAPVLVIWFGYNIVPRVLITALIAFFPLTVNVVTGFRSVDRETIDFVRSLGASRLQVFLKVSIPTAMPFIFAGLKVSATLAVIGATVSEWMGADRGLGNLIFVDTSQLHTVRVFASIALLSACGITLFCLIVLIERLSLPWHYSDQAIGIRLRVMPGRARRPRSTDS